MNEHALPSEATKWASLAHLAALAGTITGVGFIIGPLLVWLLKREEHEFIDDQGKEAVNFQITMFIAMFVAGILAVLVIGFAIMAIVGLFMILFPVIGAVKSSSGERYRYPLTLRLVK